MATERACIHNTACFCSESRCSIKCGWNPKGASERKKEIRKNGLTPCEDGTRRLVIKKGASNA